MLRAGRREAARFIVRKGVARRIVLVQDVAWIEHGRGTIRSADEPGALKADDKLRCRAVVPWIISTLLRDDKVGEFEVVGRAKRANVLKNTRIRVGLGNEAAKLELLDVCHAIGRDSELTVLDLTWRWCRGSRR